MTYANLDEAFGAPYNRCENPTPKKEKINCNKGKTTFTVNETDKKTDTRNINLPNLEPKADDGNLQNLDFTSYANYTKEPTNNNLLEGFSNPPSNQNKNNNNSNPNEMKEYSEEENNPIDFVPELEPEPEQKPKQRKRRNNKQNQINNSQIVEINNKMNFIIDQLNNNNNNNSESDDNQNNIHDIVLFILFGVFVIVILESLYKLVVKLCRYKMFNQ